MRGKLSRFSSFWIFPSIAAVLLAATSPLRPPWQPSHFVLLFAGGVFLWTFLEYLLHRFLFHIQIPIHDPKVREMVNSSHLLHHAAPRDADKVLVKPGYGLVVSTIVYALLWLATGNLFTAALLMSGIWAGFLYYEAVHYRVHFSLSPSGFIAWQRRAHFYHHFTNNKRCFGVTSPLWDYVFGTTASQTSLH
jgi:sterol desaturase/sphingolipid hydroxylase (fatty acid hydroxylase superfamily)